MSEIVSIVYKPQHVDFQPLDRYSRIAIEKTRLIEGYGIEGDRKGGHPNRQLNIMSAEQLQELRAKGFKVNPGQMGEQIVVSGIDFNTLQVGDRLQIGNCAQIEIVEWRTGCERFERIQERSRSEAEGRMGVMAKVVTSGAIRVGNPVRVLVPA